jgi:hypothetical protein
MRAGAGEGNRTLVVSLEGFCSTIELHPQPGKLLASAPLASIYPEILRAERVGWTPSPGIPARLAKPQLASRARAGGGGRIRTFEDRSRQIYSLVRLTAPQPHRGTLKRSALLGKPSRGVNIGAAFRGGICSCYVLRFM